MATGKYFVQPFLAQLLQKRENGGPAGLSYLPEISDVSNVPEGVEYFYYTGEDHDQYINGYIYKRKETRETVQVWDIITPAVTEPRTKILAPGTKYIDVLEEGFNRPVGRYYAVEEVPENFANFAYTELPSGWRCSYQDMLQPGDGLWNIDGRRAKLVQLDYSHAKIVLDVAGEIVNLPMGSSKTYGSTGSEKLFIRHDGEECYFANRNDTAGIGVIREYYGQNYLYSDGLLNIPDTAVVAWTDKEITYNYEKQITPAVWGWVEKEIITTTWQQHDAQPRGVARVESEDGTKYILVENTGTTIEGDVIAKNNLTVKGDLLVEGKEIVTDVETVQSEDDFIKLRFNNPSALGEGQSGLQVLNFDGNGAVMYLVVSGDGILRLGLGNELEPVTTRDEAAAMVDGAVTVWNAAAQKIKTGPAADNLIVSMPEDHQTAVKNIVYMAESYYTAIESPDPNTLYLIY